MKKIKPLFQKNSITNASSHRENIRHPGGYPKYTAELLKIQYPDADFEFIDLGIGEKRTKDMGASLQNNFIE